MPFVVNTMALVMLVLLSAILIYGSTLRGKTVFIRRIPGLDAIEEAVSKAVEEGRPVYYPEGAAGFGDAWTGGKMAALSLINYTAGICADKGCKILGGTISSSYIPLMDDAMRQAYQAHGRPELHDVSDVRWFPGQMAYIAGTDTIFRHEKPAAQIMIGSWWAEALAFCEIGSRAGAIQIGGTDYRPYMPYFIAICDYALIGEEIFIASAYVSRDQAVRITVLMEDIYKWIIIAITVVGGILVVGGFTQILTWLTL